MACWTWVWALASALENAPRWLSKSQLDIEPSVDSVALVHVLVCVCVLVLVRVRVFVLVRVRVLVLVRVLVRVLVLVCPVLGTNLLRASCCHLTRVWARRWAIAAIWICRPMIYTYFHPKPRGLYKNSVEVFSLFLDFVKSKHRWSVRNSNWVAKATTTKYKIYLWTNNGNRLFFDRITNNNNKKSHSLRWTCQAWRLLPLCARSSTTRQYRAPSFLHPALPPPLSLSSNNNKSSWSNSSTAPLPTTLYSKLSLQRKPTRRLQYM